MQVLKVGKLDSDLLKNAVIDRISLKRPEVLVRAGVGEDCAVIDFGEYECVLSTDPITAAVSEIGRLAIHISCNDIASNGVEPVGILLAVMLPEGSTEARSGRVACHIEQGYIRHLHNAGRDNGQHTTPYGQEPHFQSVFPGTLWFILHQPSQPR